MNRIRINGQEVEIAEAVTILEVCRSLGIEVPTLCHKDGLEPFGSCMLCVVRECSSGRLIPSCVAPARAGMSIETDGPEIRAARRQALELLLGEHVGDCEAPCRRGCPAHMDIPRMIREIRAGQLDFAIRTVKQHISLPAVLGRICPAPCEKVCRRAQYDSPVAICLLKRYVADTDLASAAPWMPQCLPRTGHRVAIVGAGPAGLTAAYYLLQQGHSCTIFDDHSAPGGMLRYGLSEKVLPHTVLDAEIEVIMRLGLEFRLSSSVGKDLAFSDLQTSHDAVILATGAMRDEMFEKFGVTCDSQGIRVDGRSFKTSVPGVFAAGAAVRPTRLAVQSVAQGRLVARAVHRFLNEKDVAPASRRFDSRIGRLTEAELAEVMKGVDTRARVEPTGEPGVGYSREEALREAARCMGCDCHKLHSCALRKYAAEYGVQPRVSGERRRSLERVLQHPSVLFEPGKCIRCGICVRLTSTAGEKLGLTFTGRGFSVRIAPPFGEPLSAALTQCAAACVKACPTGALSPPTHEEVELSQCDEDW